MRVLTTRRPPSGGGLPRRRGPSQRVRASASTPAPAPTNPLLAAALTSGGLTLVGDLLAQALTHRLAGGEGLIGNVDAKRAARMGAFGLAFYGPYQHWWYGALARALPGRSTGAFVGKVAANQLLLAPVVLAAVFAWSAAGTGKLNTLPDKIKADLVPTMVNGWKFWVPAASANFYLVPLRHQVLYMSLCGVAWTAYLSLASNAAVGSKGGLKR
jgi:protein Mpv17